MMNSSRYDLVSIFLNIFLGASILLSYSPAEVPVPSNDAGVYHYIGRGILNGDLPYRDFWDHKGPIIYYLSALGLSISDVSYWGPWFLELFFLGLAILVGYYVMKNVFGSLIASVGTPLWLFGFNSLYGGYCVEEFALPIYFLQLALFFYQGNSFLVFLKYFFIGFLGGLCFLIRPNLISPFLSIFFILFWSILKSLLRFDFQGCSPNVRNFIALSLGFVIIFSSTLLFFAVQDAGRDFYRDVFLYNILYSQNEQSRLDALMLAFRFLWLPAGVALLGWGVGLRIFFAKELNPFYSEVIRYLLVAFPIEIGLSLISGFQYGHYFIPWLPVIGFLAGFAVFQLSKIKISLSRWIDKSLIACVFFLSMTIYIQNSNSLFVFTSNLTKSKGIFSVDYQGFPEWYLVEKVLEIAGDNTSILFWGNEVQYNFSLNRAAPSRYIYLYPFFVDGFYTQSMTTEFYLDVVYKKPVIVDVRPSVVPSLDAPNQWIKKYSQLYLVVQYIYENYEVVGRFDAMPILNSQGTEQIMFRDEWVVWRHKNDN